MELFAITCTTCNARLKVRDTAAIGMILACPKCQSMVQVAAPPGWKPPPPSAASAQPPAQTSPATSSTARPKVPAQTESTSGLTIKIPAHVRDAVIAKVSAQPPAATPQASTPPRATPSPSPSPSTSTSQVAAKVAAAPQPSMRQPSMPQPAAPLAISTAAPVAPTIASDATAAPVNPNDIPPLPPSRPADHWSAKLLASARQNWLVLACAPVVAIVLALLVWIVLPSGSDNPAPSTDLASVPASGATPDTPAAPARDSESADATASASPEIADANPATLPDAVEANAAGAASAPAADMADDAPTTKPSVEAADMPAAETPAATADEIAGTAAPPEIRDPAKVGANVPYTPVPAFGAGGTKPAAATAVPPAATAVPPAATAVPPGAIAGPVAAAAATQPPADKPATAEAAKPAAGETPADGADLADDDDPATQESMPQIDVAARLADPLPGLQFKRIALGDVCEFMSRLTTIPITLDVDGLTIEGVHASDLATISAAETTMGEALDEILSKRGLIHLVDGQQLIITSPTLKSSALVTTNYNISDLTGDTPEAAPAVAALVTKFVAPLSWQERGGKARVQAVGQELIVEQTPLAQRRVAALLDKLRQARGLPAKENITPDEAALKTRYSRAKANLDKVVTANFGAETPLAEILAWLSRATGVRMLVDEASLADAGLWSRAPAAVVANRQPLYEVLATLLDPGGMTYRIVDERTIQIFARRSLADRFEVEIYPVGNLLAKHLEARELISRLRDRVDPASWSDGGGPGAIELDEPSKSLIVLQSPDVQLRLENLLLKAAAGVRPAATENR